MGDKSADVRIVEGDIVQTYKAISKYLESKNFKITHFDFSDCEGFIKGENNVKSSTRIFLSNFPQIIYWILKETKNGSTIVSVRFGIFHTFRLFFYSVLIALLIGSSICLDLAIRHATQTNIDEPFLGLKFLGAAIALIIFSFLFASKAVSFSSLKYTDIIDKFYDEIKKEALASNKLKSDINFPDIHVILICFLFFFIITVKFIFKITLFVILDNPILLILFFIMAALLVTIIGRLYKSRLHRKMLFALLSFLLSFSLVLYGNMPVIHLWNNRNDFILNTSIFNNIMNQPWQKGKANNYIKDAKTHSYFIKMNKNNRLLSLMLFGIEHFAYGFFVIIFIFPLATYMPFSVLRGMENYRLYAHELYQNDALASNSRINSFNIIIAVLWIALSFLLVSSMFFSLSIFEKALLNTNIIFKSSISLFYYDSTATIFALLFNVTQLTYSQYLLHKIIMLLYSSIFILILFLIIFNKWNKGKNSSLLYVHNFRKGVDLYYPLVNKIQSLLVSFKAKRAAIGIIDHSSINAYIDFSGTLKLRNTLIVTTGALKSLTENIDEFEALIVHEIFHLKHHSFILWLSCLLSDFTIFGTGSLVMLQDSFKMEKDADSFSVNWLAHKFRDRQKAIVTYKALLEKQALSLIFFTYANKEINTKLNFLKDPMYLRQVIDKYESSSKMEKIKMNLKLFYQMYFGNEILSYFHPTINQRIQWIKDEIE